MTDIPIVTVANEQYWPGVVALYHSFLKNSAEGFKFHAILYGDLRERAERLGISYTLNPEIGAERFPCTVNRPKETAEVHFGRIIAPDLFPDAERVLYIDADALILQNLRPLVSISFDEPVAASRSNSPLSQEIRGLRGHGFISSLMLFNCQAWREQAIFDRCLQLMNSQPVEFLTGDQAVLNFALLGNWRELPERAQAHAGHGTIEKWPKQDVFVLHFLGTNPWDPIPDHLRPYPPHKMRARELWATYE